MPGPAPGLGISEINTSAYVVGNLPQPIRTGLGKVLVLVTRQVNTGLMVIVMVLFRALGRFPGSRGDRFCLRHHAEPGQSYTTAPDAI